MTAHRIRYFGVFNDPANYAPGSITERGHVIALPTLEDARELMRTLQHSDDPSWLMQSGVRTLEGKGLPLMPGVTEGASIMLYPIPDGFQPVRFTGGASSPLLAWECMYGPTGSVTEPYPSHVVRVGARGGVIVEEVG